MSKVDALRALREAKYAARPDRPAPGRPARSTVVPPADDAGAPAAAPSRAAAPARTARRPQPDTTADGPAPDSAVEPCGHRNMSGRTCTRPAQHAEKNHRYSERS